MLRTVQKYRRVELHTDKIRPYLVLRSRQPRLSEQIHWISLTKYSVGVHKLLWAIFSITFHQIKDEYITAPDSCFTSWGRNLCLNQLHFYEFIIYAEKLRTCHLLKQSLHPTDEARKKQQRSFYTWWHNGHSCNLPSAADKATREDTQLQGESLHTSPEGDFVKTQGRETQAKL